MAPLQPLALELQRHNSKQLEIGTSSLASIAVSVDVDLDARHEMLHDMKLEENDGRTASRPNHCFNPHHLLHHRLHPLLILLDDW